MSNGEEFHVYFQVYGGQDDADGNADLEITYGFEGKAGGAWMALGEPVAPGVFAALLLILLGVWVTRRPAPPVVREGAGRAVWRVAA